MGSISGLLVHCIICTTHALAVRNKFLVSLGKVWFGVWIDILVKKKFADLSINFLFLFLFFSYL